MKVLLRSDIDGVGKRGDIIDVAGGFERLRQHPQIRRRLGRVQAALLLVDSNRTPQATLRFGMISHGAVNRAQIAQPVSG